MRGRTGIATLTGYAIGAAGFAAAAICSYALVKMCDERMGQMVAHDLARDRSPETEARSTRLPSDRAAIERAEDGSSNMITSVIDRDRAATSNAGGSL